MTSKKTKTKKTSKYSSRTPHSVGQESRRQKMISSEVFEILSTTVLNHLSDPRITGISITHVEVTKDLHHARVFISSSSRDSNIETALDALKQASGFLRKRLSTQMTTRKVPDLHFFIDNVIYDAWNLEKVIEKLESEESDEESDSED